MKVQTIKKKVIYTMTDALVVAAPTTTVAETVVVVAPVAAPAPTMTLEQARALLAEKRPIGHPGKAVVTQLKMARAIDKAEKLRIRNLKKADTKARNDAKKDAERNAKKAARLATLQAEVAAQTAAVEAAKSQGTKVSEGTVPSPEPTAETQVS